jgi:hypothetical protein
MSKLAIVGFLNLETAKFDILIDETNRAIGLLRERRTALISAAVTGKIDVCKFARSVGRTHECHHGRPGGAQHHEQAGARFGTGTEWFEENIAWAGKAL